MKRLTAFTRVVLFGDCFDISQGLEQMHAADGPHATGCSTATPASDDAGNNFDVTKNLKEPCR